MEEIIKSKIKIELELLNSELLIDGKINIDNLTQILEKLEELIRKLKLEQNVNTLDIIIILEWLIKLLKHYFKIKKSIHPSVVELENNNELLEIILEILKNILLKLNVN